jgi:hypothetical protein
LVEPTGGERQYEFRDLVALRRVRSLLDAGLPSTRVGSTLRSLVAPVTTSRACASSPTG